MYAWSPDMHEKLVSVVGSNGQSSGRRRLRLAIAARVSTKDKEQDPETQLVMARAGDDVAFRAREHAARSRRLQLRDEGALGGRLRNSLSPGR